MIKRRVKIKHFSIIGLMSPGWVRTQVRTHSDFCWTHGLGLGLWPLGLGLGLGLWSNGLGLGLGLGLWSNGLGLTPDGLGLWPDGLGLGLGLWPCGLGLTAGLTSPDSLQHWITVHWYLLIKIYIYKSQASHLSNLELCVSSHLHTLPITMCRRDLSHAGNRLVEHCADVRYKRDIPVARHFRLEGHSADNISALCIDKLPKCDTTMRDRKKKHLEQDWIIKLQTSQPSRINIKD